jgi:diadenosine tetraphosphate (Ap4A) HIT family hydrolase
MDCPFDLPRASVSSHLFEILQMSISTLYLDRIQTYRGHCVLVFDPRHVTRIDELESDEWRLMSDDIFCAEKALVNALRPDHINIASLGQVVPHLHWHIIPRYTDDPRWGGPIWMTSQEEMEEVFFQEDEYESLAGEIREKLVSGDT